MSHLPGSPEAMAEYRRIKAEIDAKLGIGRAAILEHAEAFDPDPDDDTPGETEDVEVHRKGEAPRKETRKKKPEREKPPHDTVRMPRFVDGNIRMVPISLPEDCPITPLGLQGSVFWYLDPHGQLIGRKESEHGQAHIAALFAGEHLWLYRNFPQIDANGSWKGFAAQYARDALMQACAAKGVFDARDKVRGTGCWKADDGSLIQHLGNVVLAGGREKKPGDIDGYVYPGRPAVVAPKRGGRADCEAIYTRMQTWRWERGELDARLLIGWMACVVMGPALDWRPMVFWIGDAGTGKSSMQQMVKDLLPGRLVSTIDATPAALRQIVNQDGLGVAFDEIEADMTNDAAQTVMKLARVAASGGMVYRGGSDHKASEFMLRGAFGFSAIIPPSMRQQDMQRFAFLRLRTLTAGSRQKLLTTAKLRDMGAGLAGRVADGWARWPQTLALYMEGMEAVGHTHRGAVQFGTLLAAADVLLHEDLPDAETVRTWCEPLKREGMFEYEGNDPEWLKAWRHLLSYQPEVWRNDSFPSVGEVLGDYVRKSKAQNREELKKIESKIRRAGLALVRNRDGELSVAIPLKGQAIAGVYANTDMRAHGGMGSWTVTLRGAPAHTREAAGVWYSQNCRQLQGEKCTFYRLSSVVELRGAVTPIFDPGPDLEDGPELSEAA